MSSERIDPAPYTPKLENERPVTKTAAQAIRELIQAEGPQSEGQITWKLRDAHAARDVCRALGVMKGYRLDCRTSGEIVVAGYVAGGEVYGLR